MSTAFIQYIDTHFILTALVKVSHDGTDKQHCVTKNECRIIFHKEMGNKVKYDRLNTNVEFVWLNLKVRSESHSLKKADTHALDVYQHELQIKRYQI